MMNKKARATLFSIGAFIILAIAVFSIIALGG